VPSFVFGLLLISLSSLLQAQTPENQEVSGTVVNSVTGQPIPGALIILQPGIREGPITDFGGRTPTREEIRKYLATWKEEPTQRLLTDASGQFLFRIHSTTAQLSVSRRGFRSETGGDNASISIAPPKLRDTVVKLVPLAAIQGRVVNEDGEPLSGMTVELIYINIRNGRKITRVDASKNTDDLGEYRLWDLSSGLAYLKFVGRSTTARGLANPSAVSLPEETYGSLYYPSAFSRVEAQTIRIHPGETIRADFAVAANKSYKIRGTLRNSTAYGRPTIRLMRDDDQVGVRTYVNATSGLFEMSDVTPGHYVIQAYSSDSNTSAFGEAAVTVGEGDVAGVTVSLGLGVDVKGTVQFPAESSNSNKDQNGISRRSASVQVLNDSADRPPVSMAQMQAPIDREGNFTFHNMFPGRYTLAVQSREGYVASIQAGAVDVLHDGLPVGTSEPPELKILLNSGGGGIECKVEGLEPGAMATVAFVPANKSSFIPVAYTSSIINPGFSNPAMISPNPSVTKISNLAPGEYKVFAWPSKREVEYYNPAALEALRAHAVSVYLKDGAEEKVTVKLVPEEEQ
jgi:hypothetical protein